MCVDDILCLLYNNRWSPIQRELTVTLFTTIFFGLLPLALVIAFNDEENLREENENSDRGRERSRANEKNVDQAQRVSRNSRKSSDKLEQEQSRPTTPLEHSGNPSPSSSAKEQSSSKTESNRTKQSPYNSNVTIAVDVKEESQNSLTETQNSQAKTVDSGSRSPKQTLSLQSKLRPDSGLSSVPGIYSDKVLPPRTPSKVLWSDTVSSVKSGQDPRESNPRDSGLASQSQDEESINFSNSSPPLDVDFHKRHNASLSLTKGVKPGRHSGARTLQQQQQLEKKVTFARQTHSTDNSIPNFGEYHSLPRERKAGRENEGSIQRTHQASTEILSELASFQQKTNVNSESNDIRKDLTENERTCPRLDELTGTGIDNSTFVSTRADPDLWTEKQSALSELLRNSSRPRHFVVPNQKQNPENRVPNENYDGVNGEKLSHKLLVLFNDQGLLSFTSKSTSLETATNDNISDQFFTKNIEQETINEPRIFYNPRNNIEDRKTRTLVINDEYYNKSLEVVPKTDNESRILAFPEGELPFVSNIKKTDYFENPEEEEITKSARLFEHVINASLSSSSFETSSKRGSNQSEQPKSSTSKSDKDLKEQRHSSYLETQSPKKHDLIKTVWSQYNVDDAVGFNPAKEKQEVGIESTISILEHQEGVTENGQPSLESDPSEEVLKFVVPDTIITLSNHDSNDSDGHQNQPVNSAEVTQVEDNFLKKEGDNLSNPVPKTDAIKLALNPFASQQTAVSGFALGASEELIVCPSLNETKGSDNNSFASAPTHQESHSSKHCPNESVASSKNQTRLSPVDEKAETFTDNLHLPCVDEEGENSENKILDDQECETSVHETHLPVPSSYEKVEKHQVLVNQYYSNPVPALRSQIHCYEDTRDCCEEDENTEQNLNLILFQNDTIKRILSDNDNSFSETYLDSDFGIEVNTVVTPMSEFITTRLTPEENKREQPVVVTSSRTASQVSVGVFEEEQEEEEVQEKRKRIEKEIILQFEEGYDPYEKENASDNGDEEVNCGKSVTRASSFSEFADDEEDRVEFFHNSVFYWTSPERNITSPVREGGRGTALFQKSEAKLLEINKVLSLSKSAAAIACADRELTRFCNSDRHDLVDKCSDNSSDWELSENITGNSDTVLEVIKKNKPENEGGDTTNNIPAPGYVDETPTERRSIVHTNVEMNCTHVEDTGTGNKTDKGLSITSESETENEQPSVLSDTKLRLIGIDVSNTSIHKSYILSPKTYGQRGGKSYKNKLISTTEEEIRPKLSTWSDIANNKTK